MSKNQKGSALIVGLLIAAVIAIGGLFIYKHFKNPSASVNSTAAVSGSINSPSTSPTAVPPQAGGGSKTSSLTKGNNNSDLDTDLQIIQGKMNTAVSAQTDVNTSLNNQSADTNVNVQ